MNSKEDPLEKIKQREYLKQQHQLRAMSKTTSIISADDMIESLLSNKQIFQKKKETKTKAQNSWPTWLTVGQEPPLYKQVWAHVSVANGLTDTDKTSALLLTSRLTTDTLGYIWSLTNLTVPGALTQQELYISLALVALAQNGYSFNNVNVVKQLAEPPIPKLDLFLGEISIPQVPIEVKPLTPIAQNIPTVAETLSCLDLSEPVSLLESSPSKMLSILSAKDLSNDYPVASSSKEEELLVFSDFQSVDDDFDDFKSADIFNTNANVLKVLEIKETKLEIEETPAVIEDLFPRCIVKENTSPEIPQVPEKQVETNSPDSFFDDDDKYSALRSLSTNGPDSEQLEFGDFLTANISNDTQPVTPLNMTSDIQEKCLEACLIVLKEAVEILDSVDDPKLMDEFIKDDRGKNYLEEIVEVERIGRRIRSNREVSNLITKFESLSQSLQPYIEPVKHNHLDEHPGPKCGLCLCEFGPAHVKYGINHFHAPCANLYLHKVDPVLPIAPVM